MRDERVGGHDLAKIARCGVVAEQPSVCVVRIDEAEILVAVDRDDEYGVREDIEQRRAGDVVERLELALHTARPQPLHLSPPGSQRLSARRPSN